MERIILPKSVDFIIKQLNINGYEAFVVGGCVRDCLMGQSLNDWDICTSAMPNQIAEVFHEYMVIPTGIQHGTMTVIINKEPFEITTYRIDGEYKDGRHPENVQYTDDIHRDLIRRDFTINALAYHPDYGIVDVTGGILDIKNRTIKCVGNPDIRFKEDALRILRAIRFAAKYDFIIDAETSYSLIRNRKLLKCISAERINAEMVKILSIPHVNVCLLYMFQLCIRQLFPEFDCINVVHIAHQIQKTSASVNIRLALMFADVSNRELEECLKRLRFDNKTVKEVCSIVSMGKHIQKLYGASNKGIDDQYVARTLIKEVGNKIALLSTEFASVAQQESNGAISRLIEIVKTEIANGSCCRLSQMRVNGNDMINIGLKGKSIGRCLNLLLEDIISNKINNEKEALLNKAKELKELYEL